MLKNPIGAACASLLVALMGGLATPTASHAAVYGGVYDPENPNYRWFGNHVFTVDDACLIGDGWKPVNNEYGDCGSASLTGGDLTVINKLGTPSLLDDVSKTLQFGGFEGFIPNTNEVWGINIFGGQLVGVDTYSIGNFTFADPGATHLGLWRLRWTSGNGEYCSLYDCGGRSSVGTRGSPIAALRGPGRPDVILTNSIAGTDEALPQGTTNFSLQRLDVPEPTSVTLVLAALGAGWLTRRRNRG